MKVDKNLSEVLQYRLSFIVGYLENDDLEFAKAELIALCEELETNTITEF